MRIAQFIAPRQRFRALAVLLLLAGCGLSQAVLASGSMRCGSRIVDEGNLEAELLSACGEPSYRDRWTFNIPGQSGLYTDTEVWTYDFGPSKLLRLIKLSNGRIIDIETDGYGFTKLDHQSCSPREVVEGLSKYRLVSLCGEPLTRRAENTYRTLHNRPEPYRYGPDAYTGGNQYVAPTYREEWVYNFGRGIPLRRVTLEDGWITNVELLSSGFDPR